MAKAQDWLPESVQALLKQAEPADLVVGVLTFNNANTVRLETETLVAGLSHHCRDMRILVVNCDAGSQDETPQIIQQTTDGRFPTWLVRHPLPTVYSHVYSESGVPGRESAFRTLLGIVDHVQAKGCLAVDGNLKSFSTEWVDLLARPVVEKESDLALPLYRRGRHEGSLTNTVVYPLTRALYGKRVRCHLGGCYGLSGKFAKFLISHQAWGDEVVRFGVDAWMMTAALAEGYNVSQSFLGQRVHELKPGGAELSKLVVQAVGAVFHLMERYQDVWEGARGSVPVPQFGPSLEMDPTAASVKVDRMVSGFRQGLRDLVPVWELVLASDTLQQVLSLGIEDPMDYRFPNELWVQVLYDFALAYHDRVLNREHLLKALTPLYLGYTAALIRATSEGGVEEVERAIEALCLTCESTKSYLRDRWRWQDG